eukprot:2537301-Prymnesium_polylepis.1
MHGRKVQLTLGRQDERSTVHLRGCGATVRWHNSHTRRVTRESAATLRSNNVRDVTTLTARRGRLEPRCQARGRPAICGLRCAGVHEKLRPASLDPR